MSDPKHISEIIPEAVDAMVGIREHKWEDYLARLELEQESNDMNKLREYIERDTNTNLVPDPNVGAMIYCGTGGVIDHELKRTFENSDELNRMIFISARSFGKHSRLNWLKLRRKYIEAKK